MNRILVIDDDQAVLNYLNIFLLQAGAYDVTTLANSTRAFGEIKNNAYDLLLLDMDMPNVTGLDILKHIQENSIDIETIVLTGVEDVELAVSAMKLGAMEYLTKPVDNERLLIADQHRPGKQETPEDLRPGRLYLRRAISSLKTLLRRSSPRTKR